MFRRPTSVECFFCQSLVNATSLGFNARSFRCPQCTCWNRYDARGEIMSDEPAMHDESLNARSFARRASPRKDRLPSAYGTTPFCHACQTNQMLLVNLRANYLPDPTDPEYAQRLALLPEYERSLHARYPPVCDACAAAVEDAIGAKDRMARISALGGWLKQTKGKERERKVSANGLKRERMGRKLVAWRVRGGLWVATTVTAMALSAALASGRHLRPLHPYLPGAVMLSVLWTFWDPTYSSVQRAYLQGRDVRLHGRGRYIMLQLCAWMLRLLQSSLLAIPYYRPSWGVFSLDPGDLAYRSRILFGCAFLLELVILASSCMTLRIRRPPTVRLLDTSSHQRLSVPPSSRSSTPAPSTQPRNRHLDPDLLAPLSLSSKPVLHQPATAHHPMFGMPSMFSSTTPPDSATSRPQPHEDADGDAVMLDEDEMDWTPTRPEMPGRSTASAYALGRGAPNGKPTAADEDEDGHLLRPQRFFPPEQPTGLEGLLARTGLSDVIGSAAEASSLREGSGHDSGTAVRRVRWGWVYALSLTPVVAAAGYRIWLSRSTSTRI